MRHDRARRGARRAATLRRGARRAATLLALLITPRLASAYHTADQRITDESAYTLRRGDVRLGLWKLQYGVLDQLTLGTYPWPWLLSVSNLHLKARLWQDAAWAVSVYTGFFRLDTENLQRVDDAAGSAVLTVLPFELATSYRASEALTFTLAPVWTTVAVQGALSDDAFRGAGAGAVDNVQLTGTVEWRLSPVTALLVHGRYLVAQRARASGDVILHPDEFTTIEVHARTRSSAFDYPRATSLTLSSVFSWETLNLRAGVAWGHYNVPGVNFVLGRSAVVPELDLYWVF